MKFTKDQLKLYAISDRSWLNQNQNLYDIIEQALDGGATMIQIREKNLDKNQFLKEVVNIKPLCKRYGVPLIVNDNLSIAIEAKADGVHLGQNDIYNYSILKNIPKSMIIGLSAQTVEQAKRGEKYGATYIGVGSIFNTQTKKDAQNLSIDILKEITANINIAVVAIGGITKENINLLENTSIAGISVISSIFAQSNITKATRELLDIVKRTAF